MSTSILHQSSSHLPFEIPNTLQECQKCLRQLQHEIHCLEKSAMTIRIEEQTEQYKHAIPTGDNKTAKALKYHILAEQKKHIFNKLRDIQSTTKQALTRIDIPRDPTTRDYKNCNEWVTIDTPDLIEEKLIDQNQHHFGQAHGSFPTFPPFTKCIDWSASTHISELILKGSFLSSELNEINQDLSHHMKHRTTLNSIDALITPADWSAKIKSWPKTTTTLPSGYHLSHSKVLLNGHGIDADTSEYHQLEQKCTDLIEWQVALLNAAITN